MRGVDRSTAARLVKANDWARRDYVRSLKRLRIEGDNPVLNHVVIDGISLGVDVCVVLGEGERIPDPRSRADEAGVRR
jgi:hypothetical protein